MKVDEQIKKRLETDEMLLSDALYSLGSIVTGTIEKEHISQKRKNAPTFALDAILRACGIQEKVLYPDEDLTAEELFRRVTHPYGIFYRQVRLEKGWRNDTFGAYLFRNRDGIWTALVQTGKGYHAINGITGEKESITGKNEQAYTGDALCFYAPLPNRTLTLKDLISHIRSALTLRDIAMASCSMLLITLFSSLSPVITNYLYNHVIYQTTLVSLVAVFILFIGTTLTKAVLTMANSISTGNLGLKTDAAINDSFMMRVMHLPVSFFKKSSAADLYKRINSVQTLCQTLLQAMMTGVAASVMFVVYFVQIFSYAPSLLIPALIIMTVNAVYVFILLRSSARYKQQTIQADTAESSMLYAIITGIQKIRLTGSQRRVFARWADKFKASTELKFYAPRIIRYQSLITTVISLAGYLLLYYVAWSNQLSTAAWLSFVSAYSLLTGAFSQLSNTLVPLSVIPVINDFIAPIMQAIPETGESRQAVSDLKGQIDLEHVTFRYEEKQKPVIDDLSLHIRPGDYVALVGKSGCGKSTLLRLMLGFEAPESGSVSYDEKDISRLDPASLRKHIGCVIQNSALFSGTIRSNISIACPNMTEDEIWEAARTAGIDEDIRRMPMGLETLVSENSRGISGGQKQRITIARAIASRPAILFFDEATSALDNNTQKVVSDSLARLHCTRVVIAHRLSTVRECDRILMLDGGRIIEDGTYDELIARDGAFAALVRRQQA